MLSCDMYFRSAWTMLGVALVLSSSPLYAHSWQAEAEIFRGGPPETAVQIVRLQSEGLAAPLLTIELGPLEGDVTGSHPSESTIGPKRIGVGRDLPAPYNKAHDGSVLKWITLDSGAQAARLELASPGALGLRVGLLIYALPPGIELRFYSPGVRSAPMHQVTGSEIGEHLDRQRALRDADEDEPLVYWSPVTLGDRLGIEFLLPPPAVPSQMRLALAKISHLFYASYDAVPELDVGVGASLGCHLDVACHLETWGEVARSVAKLVFTTADGFTALCSGTLISDLDLESQVPYFLTANHCISKQSEASSVQTHWFFRSQDCGGDLPDRMVARGGGATLLATLMHPDMTLLRLEHFPPRGALMAGWDATPLPLPVAVTGIHHPMGDLQKISFGAIENLAFCNIDPEIGLGYCGGLVDTEAKYYAVNYSQGLAQGGSSGSGIFLDAGQKLVGVLSAGPSIELCGAELPFYYSRFDLAFERKFFKWLAGTRPCDAAPGGWAYCSDPVCGPCAMGEGDCDSDAQCQEGLVCARDLGEEHGFDASTDVCVAAPSPQTPAACERQKGDWDYCADPACGPCPAGTGDCDADSECVGALVCRSRVGAEYGLAPDVDVCDRAPSAACTREQGSWQYCGDPACGPCAAGEGDCDRDSDCQAGLTCALNAGAKYGLPSTMDVCEPIEANSCQLAPGDWGYCSDPMCGPCQPGTGDCDGHGDCADGLVCVEDAGEQHGWPPNVDVCEAP